jgi:hypothetical protein
MYTGQAGILPVKKGGGPALSLKLSDGADSERSACAKELYRNNMTVWSCYFLIAQAIKIKCCAFYLCTVPNRMMFSVVESLIVAAAVPSA